MFFSDGLLNIQYKTLRLQLTYKTQELKFDLSLCASPVSGGVSSGGQGL